MIGHKRVRIAIRRRLGLSKPRNSGFGRGGDLSSYREFVVDGGREGEVGHSASKSLLVGVRRERFAWVMGAAGLPVA